VLALLTIPAYILLFNATNFNWFNIPDSHELYLENYDTSVSDYVNFSVYSSHPAECSLTYCGLNKKIRLNDGINNFHEPTAICEKSFRVSIECSNSKVLFYCNRSNLAAAKPLYDVIFTPYAKAGSIELEIRLSLQSNLAGYRQLVISLDGKEIVRPSYFFPGGNSTYLTQEGIRAEPGQHTVSILFGDSYAESRIDLPRPAYPVLMLLSLLISIALSLFIALKFKVDLSSSILLAFLLASASLILHFHLTSLGMNELTVPVISLAVLVGLWKKKS
jgi:hypothetical protein